jgi:hypothetical protein
MNQQQTAASIVINPSQDDRECHILKDEKQEGNLFMKIALDEKKREMPKSPEQPDDQTGGEGIVFFLQPGEEEPPPTEFFPSHTEEQDI